MTGSGGNSERSFLNGGLYIVPFTAYFRLGTDESDSGQQYEYDFWPQGEGKVPLISCLRVSDNKLIWDKRDPRYIRGRLITHRFGD